LGLKIIILFFVDYISSTTCFVTASGSRDLSTKTLSGFKSSGRIKFWTFVPYQLKLDPALVKMQQYLKLLEDFVEPLDSGLYDGTSIMVLYGLGVKNKGMLGLEIGNIAKVRIFIYCCCV